LHSTKQLIYLHSYNVHVVELLNYWLLWPHTATKTKWYNEINTRLFLV